MTARPLLTPPVLCALLAACGAGVPEAAAGDPAGDVVAPGLPPRATDPRVVQVRAALDAGEVELARALIDAAADLAGPVEGPLLRARLAALQPAGALESMRLVEVARRARPDDPRVAATAVELHAWGGRLRQAEQELARAGVALGAAETPAALLRAYGITVLCTPGARPREGLRYLEQALTADPDLPFTARALGQAHLLVATELARAGATQEALTAVERSLEHDPDDPDVRRMRVELLTALGEWGRAVVQYEELLAEGQPLAGEAADLYMRAGVWAEINHRDRALALRYLGRALELGLPRSALLDTARRVLVETAAERAHEGGARFHAGDLEGCGDLLEEALRLDPDCLAARNFRGDLLHLRGGPGAFERAAADWQHVITSARLEGLELPEPVHLKLARLQVLGLDDLAAALETLQAYLVLEPQGRWVEETRALLDRLPPPPDERASAADGGGDDSGGGGPR